MCLRIIITLVKESKNKIIKLFFLKKKIIIVIKQDEKITHSLFLITSKVVNVITIVYQ